MRLLLDTHAFLWFAWQDAQLSSLAAAAIRDPNNEVLLSLASCWEMAIKIRAGKLTLGKALSVFVQQEAQHNRLVILPVELTHLDHLGLLPVQRNHKDPFDQLLAAQALVEQVPIISIDSNLDPYGVNRMW